MYAPEQTEIQSFSISITSKEVLHEKKRYHKRSTTTTVVLLHFLHTKKRSSEDNRLRWWTMTGSNCRHPACKAGALPAELIVHVVTRPGIEPGIPP